MASNAKVKMDYDPKEYWGSLVRGDNQLSLDEVGHPNRGRAFNIQAYTLRLNALKRALGGLNISSTSRIFDVGFGVGFYLEYWNSLKIENVSGVDLSESSTAALQTKYPSYELHSGDVSEFHKSSVWSHLVGKQDLVTAFDILYHIVDDEKAEQALKNMAQLSSSTGHIVLTDKSPIGENVRETSIVARRSVEWYKNVLQAQGFELKEQVPVFWCMDPPVFTRGMKFSATLGMCIWASFGVILKRLKRNSKLQDFFGTLLGSIGKNIDLLVVPRLKKTPNLTLLVFESKRG